MTVPGEGETLECFTGKSDQEIAAALRAEVMELTPAERTELLAAWKEGRG